jgi:CelD/BcsL family acetyltransferase involved in cellulose biosynthesis
MASERSDYLGFVSEKSLAEVLPSVLEHLSHEGISWDYVKLSNLALSEGELESIVSQVGISGYRSCARIYTMAPFLPISGSWDNYLNSLGKEQNKKIRKKEKRLLSKGNLEIVKCVDFVSEDTRIGNIFQAARRIELLGWKYREGSQRIQTDDRSEKFFEKFLRGFADRGWLESWFVLNDGNPIAYAFNFQMEGRVYAYNSSYDERYREMGPGALLHIFRIRDAHERGRKEYDFLRGLEPYKSEWTSRRRKLFELHVFNRPPYATHLVRNAIQFRIRLAGSETLRAIRARILGWRGKSRKLFLPKGKDEGSERP